MRWLGLWLVPILVAPPAGAASGQQSIDSVRRATSAVLFAGVETHSDFPPADPPTEGGGSATNFCQATPNSFGTTASISHLGSLNMAEKTFGLRATGVSPIDSSWGMFTYGLVETNTPFANGYLCISPFSPGINRMPTQPLGSGTVIMMMNAHPAEFVEFTLASTWLFQFWYRDPQAGGANFNLSDGLRVTFAP